MYCKTNQNKWMNYDLDLDRALSFQGRCDLSRCEYGVHGINEHGYQNNNTTCIAI